MSRDRRGLVEILSALGIIGSLIFVGLEIRQSNRWARQEALEYMVGNWIGTNVPWAIDERFSSLAARQDGGARAAEFSETDHQSLLIMHLTVD